MNRMMSSVVIAPKSFMESLCTHPSPGSLVVLRNHWCYRELVECYYLPPVAEGRGREIIKCLLYVCTSRFCINLNISFIYEDTVEPQLSEPTGRHTIGSDKRGVQIGEMQSCSDENWGSVGDNQ